ncbi:MAG: DUF2892 domain-containing protein [Rhodobacteraceae bacterium CG17_big_fil_post_rev_8_21_14_2_50_63_15]|nr:MAG: DUF2892 domain-containing protein [Rhodobacteraceae bacterium CG17_big_fil_post_rev_8_21_14_2_50_63_15]
MTANIGSIDRIIRIVLGIVLLALAFGGVSAVFAAGAPKWIAAIAGIVLIATAGMRFCPLYRIFGIRTCKL